MLWRCARPVCARHLLMRGFQSGTINRAETTHLSNLHIEVFDRMRRWRIIPRINLLPPPPLLLRSLRSEGSKVDRWPVPQERVSWSEDWPEYQPVEYTAPSVLAQPAWADPPQSNEGFYPQYNALDGQVQRTSFEGTYKVMNGSPRNPSGRTGVIGRGLLGRWGPNHAADPIITRWKRDAAGGKVMHPESEKPLLQFVAIQRKDCGQWAIPGGMVDPGELVTATLRREFCEEALNSLESTGEEQDTERRIQSLFSQQHLSVYRGYVDDPRNTDNAWMETQAVNYHDETGHILDKLSLQAGDDAGKVQWVDMSSSCSLYANHAQFIQIVAEKRGAHW